jgi:predicted phosphodiesterase
MTMQKIGIITDVHANLPALEAVLMALEDMRCDVVVHTGDAIAIGPYPSECLDLLLNRQDTHLLMGNHDEYFAFGFPNPQPAWMSDGEWEHQRWTHAQLSDEMRDQVATWPYAIDLRIGDVVATFCHYARGQNEDGFAPIIAHPTADDLDRLFGSKADVTFYGHHHPTSDLQGVSRYINPGALGCHVVPEARFAVLSIDDEGSWSVELCAVAYDRDQLFRTFEQRQVPGYEILQMFFGQSG